MEKEKVKGLEKELLNVSKEIISANDRLPPKYKKDFIENTDSEKHHSPNWHQWGITTHSLKMGRMYDTEMKKYLKNWGLDEYVQEELSEEIDGMKKSDLLRRAMPLHDLGKYGKTVKRTENGEIRKRSSELEEYDGIPKYNFDNHAKMSKEIILDRENGKSGMYQHLKEDCGLTPDQIKYIAECAENHYELGFVRKEAKKTDEGYTIDFVESEKFKEEIEKRKDNFQDMKVETGILFLGDSMAKTDVKIPSKNGRNLPAQTDSQIEEYEPQAMEKIKQRGLNPNLIDAAKQRPVNIKVAEEYLRMSKKNEI